MKQIFDTRGPVLCVLLICAATTVFRPGHRDADADASTPAASETVSAFLPQRPFDPLDKPLPTRAVSIAAPAPAEIPLAARLPASLQGSEPDGAITVDALGNVQATTELRRLFDYFLSAIGEVSPSQIRVMLQAYALRLYGAGVAEQVTALFDRYVDYQRALAENGSILPSALDERLAFVKRLRRQYFDAGTAAAFFGEEEAYTDYTLARMRIARSLHLDQKTREESLRALERTLPAEQLALRQEASTALIAEEQSSQFQALGLDQATRHRERSALFGDAAAARLAALDRDRSAWENRLIVYAQARDAILSDATQSDAERRQSVYQLRRRSFDAIEARRIVSLESIGQL